jgi:phage terminase large subunit
LRDELKKLTHRQQVFVEEYLQCWTATEAARRAGFAYPNRQGPRLLSNVVISEAIKERLKALQMNTDEILIGLTEQARGDIGAFFQLIEEWTFYPLPSYEILGEKEVDILDEEGKTTGEKKISYWVRHVAIDMDKVIDPKYSKLIHKFTDSRRNGLGLELYDKQSAYVHLAKINGMYKDKVELATLEMNGESTYFPLPADSISSAFYDAFRDIRDHKHTEYLFYGGRGSTKSSFVSLVIIYLLVNNPQIHALATRQVGNTLRDSVYSQLSWAIDTLGLMEKFKRSTSPLEITYLPTGQKIYFRGADDPLKIKSIKPPFGYIGILWCEELDQFRGPETVRSIEQSAIRGGDIAYIFKTFNPPKTANNWANKYTLIPKASQYQLKTDYLSVPKEWLGQAFLDEAEHLKEVNLDAYDHEYLGIVNGIGGMVFENVQIREITDEEIYGKPDGLGRMVGGFDHITCGLDWGWYPDPAHFGRVHYDAARRILYIFAEYRAWKKNNKQLYEGAKKNAGYTDDQLVIADSAEPKSVADWREYGASCRGAEKGPDSVNYSMKWLQGLTAIVIDPVRAPYSTDEFINYEYEQDRDGNYISAYPDRDNHAIDAVGRYATNLIWRRRGK